MPGVYIVKQILAMFLILAQRVFSPLQTWRRPFLLNRRTLKLATVWAPKVQGLQTMRIRLLSIHPSRQPVKLPILRTYLKKRGPRQSLTGILPRLLGSII